LTTIDEARAEAYRREGDKRTIERIAELLATRKCPPEGCPSQTSDLLEFPFSSLPEGDGCQAHWMQYLTGEGGE